MRSGLRLLALALVLLAIGGAVVYEWNGASGPAAASGTSAAGLPLEAIAIEHNGLRHSFNVEVADTDKHRETGLMYRKSLADDAGMLFVYPETEEITMWMENTFIPLDMIFLAGDGSILSIRSNTEPMSREVISSGAPAKAVLEVKAGTAARLGLAPGGRLISPRLPGA